MGPPLEDLAMESAGSLVGRPMLDGRERLVRRPAAPVAGDVVGSFNLERVSPHGSVFDGLEEDAQLDYRPVGGGLAIGAHVFRQAQDSLVPGTDDQASRRLQRAVCRCSWK